VSILYLDFGVRRRRLYSRLGILGRGLLFNLRPNSLLPLAKDYARYPYEVSPLTHHPLAA
jgi:hypothetical protein